MHFITEILIKILENKITVYDRKINTNLGLGGGNKTITCLAANRIYKKIPSIWWGSSTKIPLASIMFNVKTENRKKNST